MIIRRCFQVFLMVLFSISTIHCGSDRDLNGEDIFEGEGSSSRSSSSRSSNSSSSSSKSSSSKSTSVCIYQYKSRMACPGSNVYGKYKWACVSYYKTLTECRSKRKSKTSCSGSCCSRYTYTSHKMVKGTCSTALPKK